LGKDVDEIGSMLAIGADVGGISMMGIGVLNEDHKGHEVE
jgi:hypothetical protein